MKFRPFTYSTKLSFCKWSAWIKTTLQYSTLHTVQYSTVHNYTKQKLSLTVFHVILFSPLTLIKRWNKLFIQQYIHRRWGELGGLGIFMFGNTKWVYRMCEYFLNNSGNKHNSLSSDKELFSSFWSDNWCTQWFHPATILIGSIFIFVSAKSSIFNYCTVSYVQSSKFKK